MNTNTATSPATESAPVAKSAPKADAKAEAIKRQVAYANACQKARQLALELTHGDLLEFAKSLGESANVLGRPSFPAWHLFITAIGDRKVSYPHRAEFANTANKSQVAALEAAKVTKASKPVARITGKANHDKGSQSYAFNAPAATAEALGE